MCYVLYDARNELLKGERDLEEKGDGRRGYGYLYSKLLLLQITWGYDWCSWWKYRGKMAQARVPEVD